MNKDTQILNQNIDKTIVDKNGTYRKPRGIASYEFSFIWPGQDSYARTLYHAIIKGFSSVFEYKGMPDDFRASEFEMFLIQSGRMKIIQVGGLFIPVHVTPKKYNNYGDWVKSTIIEPYLPKLSGKETEIFKNVEIKNNVLGTSLIREIHFVLNEIDKTFDEASINSSMISGKLVFVGEKLQDKQDNNEIENSLNQWFTNGKPVKLISKDSLLGGEENPIHTLDISDSTQSYIERIKFLHSELLNILGIPNNNADGKKERMIVSEISIQNILQSSILEDMLKSRQRGIEQFNKTFNMNASVNIRTDLEVDKKDIQDSDTGDDNE